MYPTKKLWLAKGEYERRADHGFSLIETLVGLVVILVVLLGIALFMQSAFLTATENRLRVMAISELKACVDAIRMGSGCCKNPIREGSNETCNVTPEDRNVSFLLEYNKDDGSGFHETTVSISYYWHGLWYNYSLNMTYYQ